ncbi:homoserine kinase [Alteribacter populi]|uniref:homoserine kinase n=1 Tax=Alteribacter populi TaxID=2011011 RepID=UPI000BBB3718|nr:homoserine kinase [Alteribacter populi]
MNNNQLFSITVPGSSANLGPGFDSIGLAINRYLTIRVSKSDDWKFIPQSANLDNLPSGKTNLIYQTAASIAEDFNRSLSPCEVLVTSEIPLARGFGSSAAAIVAGIELADKLLNLKLSITEKVQRASRYEGHPDNVAASIHGGLVIGTHLSHETEVVNGIYPEVDIVAVIPDYELKTSSSRNLLPSQLPYKEAVQASSISNVLVAALMQNNWDLAGKMMQKDLFHHPYREHAIPELKKAASIASELNVHGFSLSGAGPTIMCFAPQGTGADLQYQLKTRFQSHIVQQLKIDKKGVVSESHVTYHNN